MSNYNVSDCLVFRLVTVLLIGAMAETSHSNAQCWQSSGPVEAGEVGFCLNEVPCIELEEEGVYDCCSQPLVGCSNPCASSGARPIYALVDLLPDQALKNATEIQHVSSRIPVSVDHTPVLPENIGQYDGIPLYHLVCLTRNGWIENHAFTTKVGMTDQMQECAGGETSFVVREAPEQATDGVVFYEGQGGDGASYFLPDGQRVTLDRTWWDDRIVSLRGYGYGTFVTLFENADFSGSSLTLSTGVFWSDLEAFGWNHRASAVLVWPLAPHIKPLRKPDTLK